MASALPTCSACARALDGDITLDVDPSHHPSIRLALLGGFVLRDGSDIVAVQPSAQRVIAYAALQNRPVARSVAAGNLWPETDDGRAAASLRSALWRLPTLGSALVRADHGTVALSPDVDVDVSALHARAQSLLAGSDGSSRPAAVGLADTDVFETELLPGWWDEWVIAERERLRILQLAVLEEIGRRLIGAGRSAVALDICLRLIGSEPLRESAHRLVMQAHLAQGNRAEALQHYRIFRELLWRELSILPSEQMDRLASQTRVGLRPVGVVAVTAP